MVAAVLADAEGRVLLARRGAARDLPGAWEFPGGKVEPGEAPLQALARELDEELGIDIEPGDCTPLIAVPFAYAHKRIVLDVYRVARWDGQPRGREKQALAWAPQAALGNYDMPAADRPVVAALRQPHRYLVTPQPEPADLAAPRGYLDRIAAALLRSPGHVQLRCRGGDPQQVAELAHGVARLCREAGCTLLLNSALAGARQLVPALGAGLHLTGRDLREGGFEPPGGAAPLAASCHDAAELVLAAERGVDFAVLGPVQPTSSHPGATPLGWAGFARLRERSDLPIYAIGGMGEGDLVEARRHGAQGVAAIRGFQAA